MGPGGASAVLNPSSYSRLLGSLLIPGASRPTSKLLYLSPMTQDIDGAFVSAGLTPFMTLQGALYGAGRGHQLCLTLLLFETPRLAADTWCLSAHL